MRAEIRLHGACSGLALILKLFAVLSLSASLQGCVGALFAPRAATVPELMTPEQGASAMRAMQDRRVADVPEPVLQAAALSVIQDLGYQIRLSDAQLGLIIGTRGRQAFLEGLGEGELQLMEWFATFGYVPYPEPRNKNFNGTAVVLVIRSGAGTRGSLGGSFVRVQFYRFLRQLPNQNILWADTIRNADDYDRFFSLLSSAVVREAAKK